MSQMRLINLPEQKRTVRVSAFPAWMGEGMRAALAGRASLRCVSSRGERKLFRPPRPLPVIPWAEK